MRYSFIDPRSTDHSCVYRDCLFLVFCFGFFFFRRETSILNGEITGLSRTTELQQSSAIKVHKTNVYSEIVNQYMQSNATICDPVVFLLHPLKVGNCAIKTQGSSGLNRGSMCVFSVFGTGSGSRKEKAYHCYSLYCCGRVVLGGIKGKVWD